MQSQVFNKVIGTSAFEKLSKNDASQTSQVGDTNQVDKGTISKMCAKTQEAYTDALQSCIICNSCRYCEGLCAVFPAMEKKREFNLQDIDYLANLCHQCSECFYDCQYAPPHEFNVSIPQQFATIRQESYKKYAFLRHLSVAFEKNALISGIVLLVLLFLGFCLASAFEPSASVAASGVGGEVASAAKKGDFFAVIPYGYMVGIFMIVGCFSFVALAIGFVRFGRAIELKKPPLEVITQSLKDTLSLRYLGGHKSEGCTYPNALRSNARRIYHHLTAYGFLFCFIATNLGAIWMHFLGLNAPYDITQAPKIFGLVGGIMLCVGTLGLLFIKLEADDEIKDSQSVGMDYVLIVILFLSSFSGLCLMVSKQSLLLAYMLYFHLSTVLAFFVMMPYSKFVHIFYRFIALLKYNTDEYEMEHK
ncbi:tricarballylate utilization 4Fe-4S protein TcuB [Helicobacter macacae]|uniref:CitB domain-containing protein n=1 Tax=Helicobacter macacae MIT 99-5501 TaxID=1357400 RepID=V8CBQ2_9HELI|nr:tricarballylate utilization 4Fe-4S protein TcuB [Helicobacter macacae]ETD24799.1 hypothetical protein HMPREF2086_00133 [Helicobacter macacae MIT 99-5501]